MSLGDRLYVPGTSVAHRIAPETKIIATLVWVFAVVATPRSAFWAFGIYALIGIAVAWNVGLRPPLLARRLAVEVPFVFFAVLLPIVGRGDRIDVAGISLSRLGLWAAWNILAKATLGVMASVVLASTTQITDLLRGLERLKVPSLFVSICGFMVRYADVVAGELQRMKVARISRGDNPRWIWQAKAVAGTAGTLFVRSYERGERVHLAMLSRGYTGVMPTRTGAAATTRCWVNALSVPAIAVAIATTALVS